MGSSPDKLLRASEARTHTAHPRDATREAPRTIEDARTDALTRIKARRTRDANPFVQQSSPLDTAHPNTAHQTIEYPDDQTVESFPSDTHYRRVDAQYRSGTDHIAHAQPDRSLWEPGTLVANRYRLLEPLGAGAWGTIWKARQEGIGRFVAVKILKEREPQSMTNARSRFEREAKLASRVRHPSAVRILDFGYRNNQPYLVMEWLQGLTLQSFLRECGPLPPELVVDIGVGICGALHAAHQEGVIHRDLKPSNIMLVETSSGLTPVVVDFGLARTFAPDEATVTRDDMIVGTPAYMCPESIRGRPLTPTSDIYSLGVTFLTALLGENPFRGESGSVTMTNHLLERPVDKETLELIGCSSALASALLAMIAMEPEDRPTARVLEHHFQQLLDEFIRGDVPDTHPAADVLDWSDEAESWTLETSDIHRSTLPPAVRPKFSEAHAAETPASLQSTAPLDIDGTSNAQIASSRAPTPHPAHPQTIPSSLYATLRKNLPVLTLSLLIITLLGAILAKESRIQSAATQPDAVTDAVVSIAHGVSSANTVIPDTSGAAVLHIAATAPSSAFEEASLGASLAPALPAKPMNGEHNRNASANAPDTANSPAAKDTDPIHDRAPTVADDAAFKDTAAPNTAFKDTAAPNTVFKDAASKGSVVESPANKGTTSHNDKLDDAQSSPSVDRPSRSRSSSRRSASTRTNAADVAPAVLVLTLSPPGEVHIGNTSYGLRSSLMLDQITSGRHTIRVKRGDEHEERRVNLKPGQRHVESF